MIKLMVMDFILQNMIKLILTLNNNKIYKMKIIVIKLKMILKLNIKILKVLILVLINKINSLFKISKMIQI